MNDARKTKAQLIDELDGLRGEAVVEQALERVRLPALRIEEIADLDHVSRTLLIELTGLDLPIHNSTIAIFDEASNSVRISIQRAGLDVMWAGSEAPFTEFVSVVQFNMDAWREGKTQWRRRDIKSEEWTPWVNWWIARAAEHSPDYSYDGKDHLRTCEHAVPFSSGALILHSPRRIPDESLAVVKRFAGVFDFAYSRFLELKQKEDQNRELTIQNALERVRSKALGMRESRELSEVAKVLREELKGLEVPFGQVGIALRPDDEHVELWFPPGYGLDFRLMREPRAAICQRFPWVESAIAISSEGVDTTYEFPEAEWADFEKYYLRHFDPGGKTERETLTGRRFAVHNFYIEHGSLMLSQVVVDDNRADAFQFAEEDRGIARRFADVFEFAYSRFLELKAKEDQNRELTIQNALERVRSRHRVCRRARNWRTWRRCCSRSSRSWASRCSGRECGSWIRKQVQAKCG